MKKDISEILDSLKRVKPKPYVKYLSEKFGGKWIYRAEGIWECTDGKRTVRRVNGCLCDDDCDHPSRYCMYFSDGRIPEWVI